MSNIPDRIGGQNVIRVLTNAVGSPTRIVDLLDVVSENLEDGYTLVYNAELEKFVFQRDLLYVSIDAGEYGVD